MAGYSVRNIVVITLFLAAAVWQYFSGDLGHPTNPPATTTPTQASTTAVDQTQLLDQLRAAANDPNAKFWINLQGRVIKNLKDDTEGDRHQKFLLQVAHDLTLLISHNIDVAERVPVREGDQLKVRGEYVWNHRGGVIHWTHHDPKGRKAGGWIEVNGKRYE